jgi:hypothetical protein
VHDDQPAAPVNEKLDIPMVQTPPQAAPAAPHEDKIQPMVEVVDSFNALHNMISNVLEKAPIIMNGINPTVFTGAKVEFVDVGSREKSERKCMQRIFFLSRKLPNLHPLFL